MSEMSSKLMQHAEQNIVPSSPIDYFTLIVVA